MSNVRDYQQGYNRERHTNLIRQRQQRASKRGSYPETDDLEHDARREHDLIEGSWQELEAEQDAINRF